MNATLNHPGKMTVEPKHSHHGRTLVYVDEAKEERCLILWITPEVAAQWIEALTPLAAEAQQ